MATHEAQLCDAILKLCARVEALEGNSKPTPNPRQIGSSLVERVQGAIHDVEFPHGNDEARAAIREAAIWLMERGYRTQSLLLNDEAER
jgi:hypothetical protein